MIKSRKFIALIPVFIVIFTSFPILSHAQVEDDNGGAGLYVEKPRIFYEGVVVGANFSQVDGDYYAGYRKIGLNVGGIAYARLAKHVALSMEILYTQKGSKSDGPQPSSVVPALLTVNYAINASYAEIPVMINYFDQRKSHFGIGISYSRLVNVTENITTDSFSTYKSQDLSIQYPFKKDNFDVVAGAELHLIKGLFLNVRFEYGIVPMRSKPDLPPVEYARSNQYNNLWSIRLMYLLK